MNSLLIGLLVAQLRSEGVDAMIEAAKAKKSGQITGLTQSEMVRVIESLKKTHKAFYSAGTVKYKRRTFLSRLFARFLT